MRKVTKKKHRKARTRTRARATARAITKARKGGVKHPKYDTTKQKYSQIFGDHFGTILQFSNPAHINKLIELIEYKQKENSSIRMNNQEQVESIIKPALDEFLVYANKSVSGLQRAVDAFNIARATFARVRFREPPKTVTLSAKGILKAPVIIPKNVTISDADILIIDGKNKTERQNLILALAEKDNLVEEFINDLKILAGEEEIKKSIPVPPLPYVDLSRPLQLPLPTPPPPSIDMSVPAPPTTLSRSSSYKATRTSKSPHKTNTPYKHISPHRVKSPLPVQALRVRVTTTKNSDAYRVDPKAVSVINTNRVAQGKNFKKTRRHK
jgi:hypothetical protein